MTDTAIILCAGKGTRLLPLTEKTPKCLIHVAGKPVLDRIRLDLFKRGIFKHIITTHYLGYKVGEHVKYSNLPQPRMTSEKVLRGTAGGIRDIPSLPEEFFVVNGDTLNELSYMDMYKFHKNRGEQYMTIFTHDDAFHTGGVYLLNKKCLKLIPPSKFFMMDDLVKLLPSYTLYVRKDVPYYDMGTHEKLAQVNQLYERKG